MQAQCSLGFHCSRLSQSLVQRMLTSLGHLASFDGCMQHTQISGLRIKADAGQQAVGEHGQVVPPASPTAQVSVCLQRAMLHVRVCSCIKRCMV
jgi:hypothetical protein